MPKSFELSVFLARLYTILVSLAGLGWVADGVSGAIVWTLSAAFCCRFVEWCVTIPDPELTCVSLRTDDGFRRIDS